MHVIRATLLGHLLPAAVFRRLSFVHTPKHGSWLKVAEYELSCLTSQCLAGRRIRDLKRLQSEDQVWSEKAGVQQRSIDWQFTIETARTNLKKNSTPQSSPDSR